jgi:hypothetical protein
MVFVGPEEGSVVTDIGEFHDQEDAKWIVIRGQLRVHNDTPFGLATLRAYLVV